MSGDDGRREEELVFTVLPRIILACIRVHAYAVRAYAHMHCILLAFPPKNFHRKTLLLKVIRTTYGFRYRFVFKSKLSFFNYFCEYIDFSIKNFFCS
jgi:hypothetical protein